MSQTKRRTAPFVLAVVSALAAVMASAGVATAGHGHGHGHGKGQGQSLWHVYDQSLRDAKYVDLTHTITPTIPVWAGFGPSIFAPAKNPVTGVAYTYVKDGFEATAYMLQTDQLGT